MVFRSANFKVNEFKFLKMSKAQVLNDQLEKSEKWGVSFDGINPKSKDYVECASKEDAIKLEHLINNLS